MRSRFFWPSSIALLCASFALSARAQTPHLVKDLNPAGHGLGTPVGAAGDRLVFVGTDGSPGGQGLWATDGTDASTRFIAPGLLLDFQTSLELGDTLVGSRSIAADGLWGTDGTVEGTRRISPVPVGGSLAPFHLHQGVARNGLGAFYGAVTPPPSLLRPFVTDGTAEGTVAVPHPLGVTGGDFSGYYSFSIDAFRGGFAFAAEGTVSDGGGVWLYDPVTQRTTRLAMPSPGQFFTLRTVDERLFVNCGDLCVTDGTASGTRLVATLPGPILQEYPMHALNGAAYFFVSEPSGFHLWRSDGTAAGTVRLSSIAPVLEGLTLEDGSAVSGAVLYFTGRNAATGRELWRTDGTARGTFLLKDIDPGPGSGLAGPCTIPPCGTASFAAIAGSGLIFWAGNPATGFEAWKTDGTSAGTVPLPEIAPGQTSPEGSYLFRAGSRIYFRADDGVHGRELWAIELEAGAVTIDDAGAVTEGDGADTTVSFTVRLQSPAPQPVTVSYTTVARTAQSGSDFVPKSGTLTFAPGEREAFVEVSVVADESSERAESFGLAVTTTSGAPVADGQGIAFVLDDDGPRVAVAGASVVEGDSGTATASFAVTLTTGDGLPTTGSVTVRAAVAVGTASAADFPPPPTFPPPPPLPSVTFPAGTSSGTTLALLVPVLGDTLEEPNETFSLQLDAGNDAALPDAAPIGVILDDDGVAANPPIELTHGARIVADLAPPAGRTSDVDFYLVQQHADASYEVVVDGISGDASPLLVSRVHPIGSTLQWAQPIGTGNSVAMSWVGIGTLATEHVRVESAGCGSACGSDDTYRLRFYETTLAAPRINNQGAQVTAVILQNTTTSPAAAVLTGWRADGAFGFRSAVVTIPPRGTAVVDTTQEFAGFVGSLTVAHTAPYGALVGKVVALDPAVGLAFDTPLRIRPR